MEVCKCKHTHAHAYTHTRTLARVHARTHTCMRTRTHKPEGGGCAWGRRRGHNCKQAVWMDALGRVELLGWAIGVASFKAHSVPFGGARLWDRSAASPNKITGRGGCRRPAAVPVPQYTPLRPAACPAVATIGLRWDAERSDRRACSCDRGAASPNEITGRGGCRGPVAVPGPRYIPLMAGCY